MEKETSSLYTWYDGRELACRVAVAMFPAARPTDCKEYENDRTKDDAGDDNPWIFRVNDNIMRVELVVVDAIGILLGSHGGLSSRPPVFVFVFVVALIWIRSSVEDRQTSGGRSQWIRVLIVLLVEVVH